MPYDYSALARLDKRYVWHPYTQMSEYIESDPLIIVEGEGSRLKDALGRWYYDGVSSIWLNVHGHRVPEIDQAIVEQIGKIAHSTLLGQANVPSILLAEKLVKIAPEGLTKIFYSDSGSEAVEAALKLALQYWTNVEGLATRRRRFLSFKMGYHGDTLGAVAVAPVETFHKPFNGLLSTPIQVSYPNPYRSTHPETAASASLAEVEARFAEYSGEIAAVIVEPVVQNVAGIVIAPDGFLAGLSKLCQSEGSLLIADEVATGLGRTGKMFACDHDSVTPDIMALGKGLAGGYLPLAATLTTERVYEAFLGEYEEMKTFFHGHSFTGNQLGCAAALANLELFESSGLLQSLQEKQSYISERLSVLVGHPFIGDIRHKGLVAGIELVADRKEKISFPWEMRAGWRVSEQARELGLLIRPLGSVVVFMPPIGSSLEELSDMLDILIMALWEAKEELSELTKRLGQ